MITSLDYPRGVSRESETLSRNVWNVIYQSLPIFLHPLGKTNSSGIRPFRRMLMMIFTLVFIDRKIIIGNGLMTTKMYRTTSTLLEVY
ncbi:hypothetical protein PFISCL1PPCAC_28772, partial [Pristionchus fissidentatus]